MARSKKWLIENVNKIMGIISAFAVLLAFVYCPLTVYRADSTSVTSDMSSYVTSLVFPSTTIQDGYKWNGNAAYESPRIFPTQEDKFSFSNTLELEIGKTYRMVLDFDSFNFDLRSGYSGNKYGWIYTQHELHIIPRVVINGTEFVLNYDSSGNSYIFEFTNMTEFTSIEFHLDYYVVWISGTPSYPQIVNSIQSPDITFDVYTIDGLQYEDICLYEPIYNYQCLAGGTSSIDNVVVEPDGIHDVQIELKYGDNVNLAPGEYKLWLRREDLSYTSLNFESISSDYAVLQNKYMSKNYFQVGNEQIEIDLGHPDSLYTISSAGGYLPINYIVQDGYYVANYITQQITVPATFTSYNTKFYIYKLTHGSGGTVVEPPIGGDTDDSEPGGSDDEYNGELDDEFSDAMDKSSELDDVVADAEITKPDIDKIDVDISDLVSTDDIAKVTDLLSILTERNIVKDLILISLTVALVGYVFFGKR